MSLTPSVLFDLDGTLIDSEKVAIDVTRAYFRDEGHSPTNEHLDILIGRAWAPAVEGLLKFYPVKKSLSRVLTELLSKYRFALQAGVPEIPGSLSLVRMLAGEFRLGVVSGSHREDILSVLSTLGVLNHFQVIIGAEDSPESKPSALPYRLAIERMKIQTESVLVFEDSIPGIQSAQAAGLEVVALLDPSKPQHSHPDTNWVISDFRNVDCDWVRRRARPVVF